MNEVSVRPKIAAGYQVRDLTVVSRTNKKRNGYSIWRCDCSCGRSIELDTRTLQRQTVKDCGCITKVPPGASDLTGRRFGKLVAVSPTAKRAYGGIVWRCLCDCDNVAYVSSKQLICGYTKSCGCLGHPPLKDFRKLQ